RREIVAERGRLAREAGARQLHAVAGISGEAYRHLLYLLDRLGHAPLIGIAQMVLLIAILLAAFLLPTPWNIVVVLLALLWELLTAAVGLWYARRGHAQVGAETLVGKAAQVITRCAPLGQVKLGGEIWAARCDGTAEVGETVRVRSVEGLTLVVDRVGE